MEGRRMMEKDRKKGKANGGGSWPTATVYGGRNPKGGGVAAGEQGSWRQKQNCLCRQQQGSRQQGMAARDGLKCFCPKCEEPRDKGKEA